MKLHVICTFLLVMHMYSGAEALNDEFFEAIRKALVLRGLMRPRSTTPGMPARLYRLCQLYCLRNSSGRYTVSPRCGRITHTPRRRACIMCRVAWECTLFVHRASPFS